MRKFVLPLALMAVFALVFMGAATAQDDTPVSIVNGTIVGDRGGSHVEYTATMPQNTDVEVTVEYSPCGDAAAIPLVVYSDDGQVTQGVEDGHCRKSANWNTAGGTGATIKLSNYLHGIALYYVMGSTGFDIDNAAVATTIGDVTTVVKEAEAADKAAADAETMAAAGEAAGMLEANAATGEVLGTSGGGHDKYDIELTGGEEYGAIMSYVMDAGGTWPAVNFKIWGPGGGVVAEGVPSQHGNLRTADFVAPSDGTYTVDVYNYHAGHTAYYTITGMPLPAGMTIEQVVTEVQDAAAMADEAGMADEDAEETEDETEDEDTEDEEGEDEEGEDEEEDEDDG